MAERFKLYLNPDEADYFGFHDEQLIGDNLAQVVIIKPLTEEEIDALDEGPMWDTLNGDQ